jgi:DmsE family decaheme c-type cytochrome
MINFERAKSSEITKICLRCHTQREVTLWPTSFHAQSKLACTNCHSGHTPQKEYQLKDIDARRETLRGLATEIHETELWIKQTETGSEENQKATDKLQKLQAKQAKEKQELTSVEGRYRRDYEPELCLSCHKKLRVQINMQSRHPILEDKVRCSDCHNPHGGPANGIREVRITELCYKCHGQYEGPFVFEHPPVTEDCTTCHQPHGSPHDNLLIQNEPFLCLRCHAGPHSRNQTFTSPTLIGQFYNRCTGCHNQIHGSDRHAPFHY